MTTDIAKSITDKAAHVYVVADGEHAEGQIPQRAFSNLDGARDWVQRTYQVTPDAVGVGTWMATVRGCDEVWIRRMKVWDR